MSYAVAILGISVLIALHELGHFLVARACGMRVNVFSLGFGPVIFSHQRGETSYQLAAIPLGGFVQIEGMGGEPQPPKTPDPSAETAGTGATDLPAGIAAMAGAATIADTPAGPGPVDDPRSYRNKPLWQRAMVVFGGPLANWIICATLLVFLAGTSGLPKPDTDRAMLGALGPTGAAHIAGLHEGDRVLRIGDKAVATWADMVAVIQAHPKEAITFAIDRDGTPMDIVVTPAAGPSGLGMIEAAPHMSYTTYGPAGAIAAGCAAAWGKTLDQVDMLSGRVTGRVQGHLSGLPGIVKAVSHEARHSSGQLLYALAWLSVGLCILNLMPIPGLDGSHLALLMVEAVRRRPLNGRVESAIQTAGVVFLLGLMIFVSVRDLL